MKPIVLASEKQKQGQQAVRGNPDKVKKSLRNKLRISLLQLDNLYVLIFSMPIFCHFISY